MQCMFIRPVSSPAYVTVWQQSVCFVKVAQSFDYCGIHDFANRVLGCYNSVCFGRGVVFSTWLPPNYCDRLFEVFREMSELEALIVCAHKV